MKVKEIDVTANIAWSPVSVCPVRLAAGTAAQQLDATFSTNSALEIYDLNLGEDGSSMKKIGSIPTENRFHKIVWGQGGVVNPENNRSNGLIVGGLDRGFISVYDATKILDGKGDNALVFTKDKHTGQVSALDFNPFQHSLLASGASESEIFIWDMNKPATPMMPGAKSLPAEDVKSVAWNRQVQHILATTFSSRCVVWDLRKNDPIIKIANQGTMRCGSIAWHPDVATQMCIASDDDKSPVIQLWDLRLASSPLRVLERHSRGVLGLSWCNKDSDLLMSCGKDNKIFCWNPNSNIPGGEIACEVSSNNDGCWSFDISWCPKNPAMIATSSFDGKVSVYSLLGGQQQIQQSKTSAAIADSFPGMESMQPLGQPISPSSSATSAANQLKVAPKWMRRPCGATFGFGGKLVSFDFDITNAEVDNQVSQSGQAQQNTAQKRSSVYLSKVVTAPELVQKSLQLETSLKHENLAEFCDLKISESKTTEDQQIWKFIRANFSDNPNYEFLDLLGYNPEKTRSHIFSISGMLPANALSLHSDGPSGSEPINLESVTDEMANLNTSTKNETSSQIQDAVFDQIAEQAQEDKINKKPFVICTENNGQGMLSKALLTKNLEFAVDLCLKQNRFADALILSMQGGPELFQSTQQKYFSKCASEEDAELPLIEAVVSNNWSNVIDRCDAEKNWCESLVAALTYKGGNIQEGTVTTPELELLCCTLGARLLEVGNLNAKHQALLCFICAGSLENVVKCWLDTRNQTPSTTSDIQALQDLVEVVMLLKKAINRLGKGNVQNSNSATNGELSKKLTDYASQLASQGALEAAMTYLGDRKEENEDSLVTELRERVQGALGYTQVSSKGRSVAASTAGKTSQAYCYADPKNVPKAGGWTHPGNSTMSNYQGSMNVPYSGGIHNPVLDDLNTFNTPYPHSDTGGITTRRNSRPRNPSVEAYPPPTNAFQGSGSYVPPPSFHSDVQSNNFRSAQNMGSYNQPVADIPSQPPVNIFTPEFSKQSSPLPPSANKVNSGTENSGVSSGNVAFPGKPPTSSGPGWNDPPPMKSTFSKPKAGTNTVPAPIAAPITQPLMQVPGSQFMNDVPPTAGGLPPPPTNNQYGLPGDNIPVNPPANNFGQHTQPPSFQTYQPFNQPSHQSNSVMLDPSQNFSQQPSMNPLVSQPQIDYPQSNFMIPGQENVSTFSPLPNQSQPEGRPQPRLMKEEPKPKGPIPAENQVLQDVFDGLKTRCLAAASHPQTRRKLEDVGKKLEILYDKLRDNSLTPTTLGCLHQLITYLGESSDYQNAMLYYNSMVSGPSFSEIAAFAPTIKILIQQAIQLQIVW